MLQTITVSLLTLLAVLAGFYLARVPANAKPVPPLPSFGGVVTEDKPARDDDEPTPWR